MKNNHLFTLSLLVAASATVIGCTPERHEYEWEWDDPVPSTPDVPDTPDAPDTPAEANQAIVDLGWTNVADEFGKLPEYISVYRSPDEMEGRACIAYIAVADLSRAQWDVTSFKDLNNSGSSSPLRTPSTAYTEMGNPSIIINGGYFYSSGGKNYSASLVVSRGELLSPNINYASEDWVTIYYPTRGVFVEHKDGSFEAAWSYYKSASMHWIYSEPAPNSWSDKPCPQPSASYPSAGADFEAVTGIGGGPVLLRGGEIRNTAAEELYDGSGGVNVNNPNTPRTAIGITADKKMILFVCEGREQTPGIEGFTTSELANIMKALGCTEALNLDGGGSTCMLVNGQQTIKPSDGSQRPVASLIYLK